MEDVRERLNFSLDKAKVGGGEGRGQSLLLPSLAASGVTLLVAVRDKHSACVHRWVRDAESRSNPCKENMPLDSRMNIDLTEKHFEIFRDYYDVLT